MWHKLPDFTEYMCSWPRAVLMFLSLIIFSHLASVALFDAELFSLTNILGPLIVALLIGLIGYKQKRAKRALQNNKINN